MTPNERDNEDVLRVINELSAEASHTEEESRQALVDAGVDAERLVARVREEVQTILATGQDVRVDRRTSTFDRRVRNAALGLLAASAAFFVVSFHLNYREGIEAQRQVARAQLIAPLLPALANQDAEQRSLALVVARQVDPGFASDTAIQLARWEVNTQAQVRASRNSTYASRILAGLQKLQLSRDPDDRKIAIWNDLLPVLQEARKNREDFMDVAIEYQRVLPLLRVRNPDVFLDSYWGELWILNILLQSKIAPVVEAARLQAPEASVVEQIFARNARGLPDRDRKAFEEALTVYKSALKSLQ